MIPGSYNIVPAPPFSNGVDTVKYDVNEEIYSSLTPYPSTVFDYLGMGQLRKYSFAMIRFSPISYIPVSGELKIYKEISLKIDYKIVKELSNELLSDGVMDDVASEIIINFQSISKYYNPTSPSYPLATYDYVIITTSSLENSINFFKNWKELIGYSVKVVNKSWISSLVVLCGLSRPAANHLSKFTLTPNKIYLRLFNHTQHEGIIFSCLFLEFFGTHDRWIQFSTQDFLNWFEKSG